MSAPGRQQPETAAIRQARDRPQDGPASGLSPKREYRRAQQEGAPATALRRGRTLAVALAVALSLAAALGLLHRLGIGLPLLLGIVATFGVIALVTPWIGVRLLDDLLLAAKSLAWRREQGRHHSFGGQSLHIEDDGRQVWMAGADLQRVLGTNDREDVLAARVPGRWRRDGNGTLLLRVDAVVQHLATAPGRMDPRTVRLRRYLERDVIFPAAERRRRAS
jgi:hypothetical protein